MFNLWEHWLARYLWWEQTKDTNLQNEQITKKEYNESEQTAPP